MHTAPAWAWVLSRGIGIEMAKTETQGRHKGKYIAPAAKFKEPKYSAPGLGLGAFFFWRIGRASESEFFLLIIDY